MRLPFLFLKSICLPLIFTLVLLPATSLAEDPDLTGAKLRTLHESQEYKDAMEASEAAANATDWALICGLEYATVIGAGIWIARNSLDKCKNYREMPHSDYCVSYSEVCDHYNWSPDCTTENDPERCS